jgi:integrase
MDTQTNKTPHLKTQNEVKSFRLPQLKNAKGNLMKRWFIEWLQFDNNEGKLKRKRIWIPSKPKTLKFRYDFAEDICTKIVNDLQEKGIINTTNKVEKYLIRRESNFEIIKKAIDNKTLRRKTIQTYYSHGRLFCKYLEVKNITSLSEVTAEHAKEYLFFNRADAGNTYKNKINHLKSIFNELILLNQVAFNPFSLLKCAIVNDSDFNHPFSDYEKVLIEDYLKVNNLPLFYFTRFLFFGFIRPQELINIRIKDIDVRNRTIRVSGSISKTKKNGVIPIINPLMTIIQESKYLNYPPDFYLFGKDLAPSCLKCPINKPNFQHRQALETLGIYQPKIKVLYSWKHTGNIFAYLSGVDVKVIQKINRHSNFETTEIYLRKLGLFLEQKIYDSFW